MKNSDILKIKGLYHFLSESTCKSSILPVCRVNDTFELADNFDSCDLFHVTDNSGKVIFETNNILKAINAWESKKFYSI